MPSADPERAERILAGTFYYYRVADGEREEVWAWTVGSDPRLLAAVGDRDDLAWEHYAWQSAAVAPDGTSVAWVPRGGQLMLADSTGGEPDGHDVGGADQTCQPPVWHPDGTRLLIHNRQNEYAWFDPAVGRLDPLDVDLSHACAARMFTDAAGTVAIAYEDRAENAIVAVTTTGEALWRLDLGEIDPHLDPSAGLWALVDVSADGNHACLNIERDVVAGGGGGRSLTGNLVVETATGRVLADGRPATGLCAVTTTEGFAGRVVDAHGLSSDEFNDFYQELHLTGYDGAPLAVVEEPPEFYTGELIGYAPPGD